MLKFAGYEYDELMAAKGINKNIPMTGALMCQCREDGTSDYKIFGERNHGFNYTSLNGTNNIDVKICNPYANDYIKAKFLNSWIKYLIIMLNTVIRMVVIKIITKMGCATESAQMVYITNVVFVCQFFNTGILPMLCTANLNHQLPSWLVNSLGLNGPISDFNMNWFTNIGDTIVGSLKFNIVMPVCMEMGWWSLRFVTRLMDGISTTEENPTKSGSIQ